MTTPFPGLPGLPGLNEMLNLNPLVQTLQRQRRLPRPLPLHLLQALMYARPWFELNPMPAMQPPAQLPAPTSTAPLLPNWSAAWTGFPPASSASKPNSSASANNSINPSNNHPDFDPAAFLSASLKLAGAELALWCRGVELYASALRPALPKPMPVVWQDGTTKLRDYGGPVTGGCGTIIVVPSLVNRAGILDLLPGQSLLRHLSHHGRVLLVDWDAPGDIEKHFTLDDYIARLLTVVTRAQAEGGRVHLMGYCMGGLLALAAAQLAEQPVDRLALLATPWDFSAYAPSSRLGVAQWQLALTPWLSAGQPVPVDILQTLFALLQPMAAYEKFKKAGKNGIDDLFVTVEDWLNDGVELPARVAQLCFGDWFGLNNTASRQWRVRGTVIEPAQVTTPSLVIAPLHDQLVPHAVAAPLAKQLGQAQLLSPPLGHIGMIVGRQARPLVWDKLADFFRAV